VSHHQEPGVAVFVRLSVASDATSVPEHHDRVAVRVDRADANGSERLARPGEAGGERREDLVDERFLRRVLLRSDRSTFDAPYHVGRAAVGYVRGALLPAFEGRVNRVAIELGAFLKHGAVLMRRPGRRRPVARGDASGQREAYRSSGALPHHSRMGEGVSPPVTISFSIRSRSRTFTSTS